MLRYTPAARIASNFSPTRERREAFWALGANQSDPLFDDDKDWGPTSEDKAKAKNGSTGRNPYAEPIPLTDPNEPSDESVDKIYELLHRSGVGLAKTDSELDDVLKGIGLSTDVILAPETMAAASSLAIEEFKRDPQDSLRKLFANAEVLDFQDAMRMARTLRIEVNPEDDTRTIIKTIEVRLLGPADAGDTSSEGVPMYRGIEDRAILERVLSIVLRKPKVVLSFARRLQGRLEHCDRLMNKIPELQTNLEGLGISPMEQQLLLAKERHDFMQQLNLSLDAKGILDLEQRNRVIDQFIELRRNTQELGYFTVEYEQYSREEPHEAADSPEDARRRMIGVYRKRVALLTELAKSEMQQHAALHLDRISELTDELCLEDDPANPGAKRPKKFETLSTERMGRALAETKTSILNSFAEMRNLGLPDAGTDPSVIRSNAGFLRTTNETLTTLEHELDRIESVSGKRLRKAWEAREEFEEDARASTEALEAARLAFFEREVAEEEAFNEWVNTTGAQAKRLLAENAEDEKPWPEDLLRSVRLAAQFYDRRSEGLADDRTLVTMTPSAELDRPVEAELKPNTLHLSLSEMSNISATVSQLDLHGIALFERTAVETKRYQGLINENKHLQYEEVVSRTENHQERLTAVESRIAETLKHHTLRALGVPEKIGEMYETIQCNIVNLRGMTGEDGNLRRPTGIAVEEGLAQNQLLLGKLEELVTAIADVEKIKIHEVDPPEDENWYGYFEPVGKRRNWRIVLNRRMIAELSPEQVDRYVQHEVGHALTWAMHQTIFPDLLTERYSALRNHKDDDGQEITDEDLLAAGELWLLDRAGYQKDFDKEFKRTGSRSAARRFALEPYIDELYNQYADWLENGKPEVVPVISRLFAAIESNELGSDEENRGSERRRFASAPALPPVPVAVLPTGPSTPLPEYSKVDVNVLEVQRNITKIKSFINAYKEQFPQEMATLSEILHSNDSAKTALYDLEWKAQVCDSVFRKGNYTDKGGHEVNWETHFGAKPEYDQQFIDFVTDVKDATGKLVGKSKKFEHEFGNPEKAEPVGYGWWKSMFGGIRVLSLLDIKKIFDDTKADYLDMYKRWQERNTTEVEYAMTSWISDRVPILGRFKHYFDRRRNSSEQEDVQKWESALDTDDTHNVIFRLKTVRNKDQLRAIINYLTKNGAMDWGNEDLWYVLNELSRYKMPKGPCRDNNQVRDEWIEKLCTDIWDDYEIFHHWKTHNDSSYTSKKGEYTQTVDSYANTGILGGKLKLMLEEYVHWSHGGKKVPMPAVVSAYNYEEMLHYAMRVGKLSMEAKFYYLIKGVAEGLLPVERLQVLGGEAAGLLGTFPFLEYFYQKNNTLPQIKALAKRITELKDGHDTLEPGISTTIFLRLVVLRDPDVRTRINKATTREGKNLDHEDMPYVLTDVSTSLLKNLMANVSGGTSKITPQGKQNGYVGFNEKFKSFAKLAELQEKGKANFSAGDVEDILSSIQVYLQFDNQNMGWGNPNSNSEMLSADQLNRESPPSNSAFTTSVFRNRTRDFIERFADEFGLTDYILPEYDEEEEKKAEEKELEKEEEEERQRIRRKAEEAQREQEEEEEEERLEEKRKLREAQEDKNDDTPRKKARRKKEREKESRDREEKEREEIKKKEKEKRASEEAEQREKERKEQEKEERQKQRALRKKANTLNAHDLIASEARDALDPPQDEKTKKRIFDSIEPYMNKVKESILKDPSKIGRFVNLIKDFEKDQGFLFHRSDTLDRSDIKAFDKDMNIDDVEKAYLELINPKIDLSDDEHGH